MKPAKIIKVGKIKKRIKELERELLAEKCLLRLIQLGVNPDLALEAIERLEERD